jgi:formate dehydrogenase maturation protein FdhE
LAALVELLKILPTKEHEYFDLGDFLGHLTQIMASHESILSTQGSSQLFEDFLARLMDGLKYHLMPYLEETGVSGIVESAETCPKTYLIFRYIDLLTHMVASDMARPRSGAPITRDTLSRPSLVQYLINLYHFYKANLVIRKSLLGLLHKLLQHFSLSDHQLNQAICDLLVDQVSTVKMVFNQFEQASIVMQCMRMMVLLSKKRLLRVQQKGGASGQGEGLSSTT